MNAKNPNKPDHENRCGSTYDAKTTWCELSWEDIRSLNCYDPIKTLTSLMSRLMRDFKNSKFGRDACTLKEEE